MAAKGDSKKKSISIKLYMENISKKAEEKI